MHQLVVPLWNFIVYYLLLSKSLLLIFCIEFKDISIHKFRAQLKNHLII
jgi:hypothetical protein